jgi:uncharacterized membrane protein YphA (DoxX/SURF4 family)
MVSRDSSTRRTPDPLSQRLRPLALRPLGGPSPAPPARWWSWLGTAGGCFLGAVLLVAAWAKALDPAAFAQQLHADGLDHLLPLIPPPALVFIALALETGLGLALLLGVRRPWVLVPATLLVLFFLGLNGRAWWLAAHGQGPAAGASCGCFGNLVQRTPAEAFWQDLLLLVPGLALAWCGRDRNLPAVPRVRFAVVAGATLALLLFAWRSPELPLDNLATRLKPGVAVAKLCAGAGEGGGGGVCLDAVVPDLAHGDHLVMLDDLDDPALARAVPALNSYSGRPGAASVWLLTAADAAGQRAFFWKWGPAFRIVEAPAELLRPLYRRLPRSFAVQDGRVTATFSSLPPVAGAANPGR